MPARGAIRGCTGAETPKSPLHHGYVGEGAIRGSTAALRALRGVARALGLFVSRFEPVPVGAAGGERDFVLGDGLHVDDGHERRQGCERDGHDREDVRSLTAHPEPESDASCSCCCRGRVHEPATGRAEPARTLGRSEGREREHALLQREQRARQSHEGEGLVVVDPACCDREGGEGAERSVQRLAPVVGQPLSELLRARWRVEAGMPARRASSASVATLCAFISSST
mgnify:CR=1 FL=1